MSNNDTEFADLTKLRVKKINRTTHVFLGEATLFNDVGNDHSVNYSFVILMI